VAQLPLHDKVMVLPAETGEVGVTTFTSLLLELAQEPLEIVHVSVYVLEPAGGVKVALAALALGEKVPPAGEAVHVPVKGALTALADKATGVLLQLATSAPAMACGGSGNTVTDTRFTANRLSMHLLENWNT